MSTQLILYPQTYNGYSSIASPSTIQYIVNGINFTGFNSTILYNTTATHPSEDAILNEHPYVLGNWYRFTTTGGDYGAVTAPTYALGAVQLSHNAVTPGQTGLYQKLSQLIVGAVYDVKISVITPQAELLTFEMWDGTVIYHQQPLSANTSTITTTFTAQSSNDIFLIYYEGIAANLSISKISILQSPTSPSLIYTELQDGQVICDLYQEEDIPLSLSIDDFKNVAEQVKSYSKDFNLPATKRNNQIFNNMFEVTRADDGLIFNPYVKTKCVLKQDGFMLFEGYLRLINVKDDEGEISYNVNLYSEVTALADTLKEQTFANLDFEELAHLYNKTSIKNSWYNTTGLPLENSLSVLSFAYDAALGVDNTNVLKYPFIDWNHQFVYGQTGTGTIATANNPELTALEQAFRPCIQLKYLINKIFAASGFNWTSNFFDSTDFGNLFMDFNWGSEDTPNSVDATGIGRYNRDSTDNYATTGWTTIDIDVEDFEDEFGFDVSTGVFTCPSGQDNATFVFGYNCVFRCASTTSTQTAELELRWLFTPAGGTPVPIDATPTILMDSSASGNIDTIAPFGVIDDIDIVDGGYYTSAPTVTIQSVNGTGAVLVAVGSFPGAVTSVTVTSGGTFYNYQEDIVFFNSVNPLHTYTGQIQQNLNVGDTLQLQFKANANNRIRQNNQVSVPFHTSSIFGSVTLIGITDNIMLQTLRGETGQWEFLKGIMTMFNLVTLVDENDPDNILIEPYADVFINNINSGNPGNLTLAGRGVQHDWTDKVDVSQMELKPLTDLNKNTIFQFVEDDDDYVFNQYKNSTTGHLYGSKEIDASTASNGMPTILQGTKEIIAEPFAATVSKPLDFQFPDFITPSIYALTDDGTSEGFDNSPRIFYNNGRVHTGASYFIPTQNGVTGENQEWFLQFSHLSSIPVVINTLTDTRDFVFESQQLFQPIAPDGPPTDNLYSIYWQPYFNELYNPDTRTMILKVNLSPSDVASFKFYDTVFIKNRVFRVNKIDYKPNDLAKVEFILIP